MDKNELKKLNKIAKSNPEANLLLARMSFEGKEIPQSDKNGIKYATKAAKKGCLNANNFIGFAYANGYGVGKNVKKAAQFYTKAKAFEDGLAEYSLYVLSNSGALGKKAKAHADEFLQAAEDKENCYITYNDAVKLNREYLEAMNNPDLTKAERDIANFKKETSIIALRKAHEKGCEDATLALAVLYLIGDEIPQNFDKAKELLGMLDEQKCPLINYIYGYMYDTGLGFEQNYWKAYECYTKVYKYYQNQEDKTGAEDATIALALCQLTGLGCKMDVTKALNTFTELINQSNNPVAHYYIGLCLAEGKGTKTDYKSAGEHFKKAAAGGVKKALYQLGKLCDGNYHKDNNKPDKCKKYYEEAAQAGVAEGQIGLARCYRDAIGVDADSKKAYQLIAQAARQGNAEALYEYANFYVTGDILAQDIDEAIKYMTESAKRGNKEAIKYLDDVYTKGGVIAKDPVKAFEIKVMRALNGDEALYIQLAEKYRKGVKNIQPVDGELAAYWYAKTILESTSKKERKKAAKKLKLFARDLDGNWNFKGITKKNNKKILKKQKAEAKLAKKNGIIEEEKELSDDIKNINPVDTTINTIPDVKENEPTEEIKPIKLDDILDENNDIKLDDDTPVAEAMPVEDAPVAEAVPVDDVAEAMPVEDVPVAEAVPIDDLDEKDEALLAEETNDKKVDDKPKSKKELKAEAKQAAIDAKNAEKQAKLDAKAAKKNKKK